MQVTGDAVAVSWKRPTFQASRGSGSSTAASVSPGFVPNMWMASLLPKEVETDGRTKRMIKLEEDMAQPKDRSGSMAEHTPADLVSRAVTVTADRWGQTSRCNG